MTVETRAKRIWLMMAQPISGTPEEMKMEEIAFIQQEIQQAISEAREEAQREVIPQMAVIEDMRREEARKEGFTAGALEMRDKLAVHFHMDNIMTIPIPYVEKGSEG